jgi:TolB-like protein/DNA-binding winged helix-turn-helix (wHTH) protein
MNDANTQQCYETGGFRIDPVQRVLLGPDGTRVPLSSRAFELLLFFLRHPGELLEKDRLMAAVWPNTVVEENNLNQCAGAIRKALGESRGDHRFLVTEPGRGYRFVAAVRTGAVGTAAPPLIEPARRGVWRHRAVPAAVLVAFIVLVSIVVRVRQQPARILDRSIAVLPFENRSEARENGYLALGIQDEILTLLTRIGDLRVIPRASTARYAGSSTTAPDIAAELGVPYLLSGSVQRAGDLIRVNVTLIDARNDRHLWASSYERSSREIFAVESEVAHDVATVLQARLTAAERSSIAQPPTANAAAYDFYLRAKAFAERTTRTEAEIHEAIAAYEEAVRLDPGFAIGWAQLSRRHANLYSLGYDRSNERREAAQRALERALGLRPDLSETRTASAYLQFVVTGDLQGAASAFRALEIQYPRSPDARAGMAQILGELGQQDRSDDYAHRTLALDPLNPYRHALICQEFLSARELEAADRTCAHALELLPGDAGILTLQASILQARGELAQSRELLRPLTPAPGDWRTVRAMSRQLLLDRDSAAAVTLLATHLANSEALGSRLGVVRRWLADAQRLASDAIAARQSYGVAAEELSQELSKQPENPLLIAELAIVQARLGNRGVAVGLLRNCEAFAARARRDWLIAECALAGIQVDLAGGAPAQVVARLARAAKLHGELPPLTPALLRADPDFDGLRGRRDFQALL